MAARAVSSLRLSLLDGLVIGSVGRMILLTALAVALRLWLVTANGFNTDEVWSIWMARLDPQEMIRVILLDRGDYTPPTYYLLLQFFTRLGEDPLLVRLLSILSGAATVLIAYRLAEDLFGQRVATLSGFLLAVSPLHIQFSQLARAYVLADLWALLSLYFFSRLVLGSGKTRHWVGWMVFSAAGCITFYLTLLVVLVEDVVVVFLWLRRTVGGTVLRRWLIGQSAVVLIGLIAMAPVISSIVSPLGGRGITWIDRPGIVSLVKTVILFTTGDPSYGPAGITAGRALALITAAVLALQGVLLCLKCRGEERTGVLVLSSAALIPILGVFLVSQWRPMYGEKYLLFALPPLLILYSWVVVRSPRMLAAGLTALALVAITGRALFVYYSAPVGEQWREATSFLKPMYQAGDTVVITPGFYMRPLAYYLNGDFPADTRSVARYPAVRLHDGRFEPLAMSPDHWAFESDSSGRAQRVWLVTGFAQPDPQIMTGLARDYETVSVGEFLGARVSLLEPASDPVIGRRE